MSWYRIKRNIIRRWRDRRRLRYVQPAYDSRYGVPLKVRLIQTSIIGSLIAVIIGLIVILILRENYWRYTYKNNPVFVTTYSSPRSADRDSHYTNIDCSNKSTVDGLKKCVGFTDAGNKLIAKMKTYFAAEEQVAKDCGLGALPAGEAIFGCWRLDGNGERISLLTATDEAYTQYNESPEVTLAHEFLHGVYHRLTMSDQQRIWGELSSQYSDMVRDIESLGYDYSQVDDELFTRVGSEKKSAGSYTKAIYARYLTRWGDNADDNGTGVSQPVSGNDDNTTEFGNPGGIKSTDGNTTASQPTATTAPANHTNPDYQKLPACNVTRVSDGDTFYVDCLSQRIRLVGVDTPESTNKHQCYGNEASNHTKGLLGQRVYLETDPASGDVDTYGRPLRFVYLADGTNYNMQLIEDGYGMLYIFRGQQFNYRDKFAAAQDAARSAGKGLWSACQTGINKYGNYQVTN